MLSLALSVGSICLTCQEVDENIGLSERYPETFEVINLRSKPVSANYQASALKRRTRSKQTSMSDKNKLSRGRIADINYSPSGKNILTAYHYDKMLKDTGLENCGKFFKDIENKNNVNGLFAIAVAMHESARGHDPLPGENYFGMMGMRFKSKKENIYYFGSLISGRLYFGCGKRTIADIAVRYCASGGWSEKVKIFMKEMTDKVV